MIEIVAKAVREDWIVGRLPRPMDALFGQRAAGPALHQLFVDQRRLIQCPGGCMGSIRK